MTWKQHPRRGSFSASIEEIEDLTKFLGRAYLAGMKPNPHVRMFHGRLQRTLERFNQNPVAKARRGKYTPGQRSEVVRLISGGMSFVKAARVIGASRTAVRYWWRKYLAEGKKGLEAAE